MSQPGMVTLLTDFGLQDVYVGVIKGVIAQINPELQVIDLTHQVPPQNIAAGRFCLMNAVSYFPAGTVHLAVVDPGVGTSRRAIALQLPQGYFVGPDNGLFSGVIGLAEAEPDAEIIAVELSNDNFWRTPQPSTTFHGRDIFAPVAAHLASGIALEEFGNLINPKTLIQSNLPDCTVTEGKIDGSIQYIDQFGNLITNIPAKYVEDATWFVVINDLEDHRVKAKSKVNKKKKKGKKYKSNTNSQTHAVVSRIIPSGKTYGDVQLGDLIALVGSHGWVEIAANHAKAQTQLQLSWGSPVQVLLS
ncbi:MAG: SAM-dependent chlorinase/fluorinase [Microcoleaceae cyanobacterium]